MAHINQSKKAINRIQKLAEQNSLKYEIVFPIISLFWNYDGEGSWAEYENMEDEFNALSSQVISQLKISYTFPSKDVLLQQLLHELKTREANQDTAYKRFLYATVVGNGCIVSEFATTHYLRNANHSRLLSMDWSEKADTNKGVLWALFLKLFRAGCGDRNNLDYVFADLCLPLPHEFELPQVDDWTIPFIEDVNSSPKVSLTDLKKLLLKYVPKSKDNAQSVLEALVYAEILNVKGHPITDVFLFDKRYELASHYHSNEYHYPLRFWNEQIKNSI